MSYIPGSSDIKNNNQTENVPHSPPEETFCSTNVGKDNNILPTNEQRILNLIPPVLPSGVEDNISLSNIKPPIIFPPLVSEFIKQPDASEQPRTISLPISNPEKCTITPPSLNMSLMPKCSPDKGENSSQLPNTNLSLYSIKLPSFSNFYENQENSKTQDNANIKENHNYKNDLIVDKNNQQIKYPDDSTEFREMKQDMQAIPKIDSFDFFVNSPEKEKIDTNEQADVSFYDGITFSEELVVTNSISEIINKAQENAKIIIPKGEYKENIKICKNLHFIGIGNVRIVGVDNLDTISIQAQCVTFNNITITHTKNDASFATNHNEGSSKYYNCIIDSQYSSAINLKNNSKITLRKCTVSATNSIAVIASQSSSLTLLNSTIYNSSFSGIKLKDQSMATIDSCIIRNNKKYGIYASDQSQIVVNQTEFLSNGLNSISFCSTGNESKIEQCTFNNNETGILAYGGSSLAINNCTFDISQSSHIEINDGSKAQLSKNIFMNTKGHAKVLVWSKSQITSDGDQFFVTGNGIASVDGAKVSIQNATFNDIDKHCGICYGDDSTMDVNKCKIYRPKDNAFLCHTKGLLQISNCEFYEGRKLGILVNDAKSITVKDTTIRGFNKSGIEINTSEGIISNTKLLENGECGVLVIKSKLDIDNKSIIEGNKACGIHALNADVAVKESKLRNNNGAGVFAETESKLSIENSSIKGSAIGACFSESSSQSIKNSKFKKTSTGIQITEDKSLVEVESCLFKECNIAILSDKGSEVHIKNSDFDRNGLHIAAGRSKVDVNGGTFKATTDGIAFDCSHNSNVNLQKVTISDETKCGIASCGHIDITESKIENCGKCGIYLHKNAEGNITENNICGNGDIGIFVFGGRHIIDRNIIKNHKESGIYINLAAYPSLGNNIMSNNGCHNIFRE